MITYNEFLANVNTADLAMLTEFVQGKRITAATSAEADGLFVQAQRLYNAGLLWRVVRGYDQSSGVTVFTFDGYCDPAAAGYIAQLARDRIAMSRQPLP